MAIRTIRSASGVGSKSYFISNSTTEYVSVDIDNNGAATLGKNALVGLSHVDAVDYSDGGTGWQCEVDDSIEVIGSDGKKFWGGIAGTRRRR